MAESQSGPISHAEQAALIARIERLESLVAQLTSATPPPPAPAPAPAPAAPQLPAAAPRPSRAARSPSLESDLGARVFSKIAILLLLMSAAWFLKWAFDNRWIGPLGRVVTGLIAGAAVMLWSERSRRQRLQAFSYALKAVGSGVLYLSLWAGFQVYHLLPATAALAAMVLVTAANGALAIAQDAEALAALALLGGLLTPLILSTGSNQETFLFTYLFVLSAATILLLRFKPWNRLLAGVFPVVVAYFFAWYTLHFMPNAAHLTLFFALLLWAVFASAPFIAQKPNGLIVPVLLPLAAAAFGAFSVYLVLSDSSAAAWEPWAAIGFAAAYLALARARREGLATTAHLSLAFVFLAIAITLKATGRAISVGWLAEAIALQWLASRPPAQQDADSLRATHALRWLACILLLLGTAGALLAPHFGGSGLTPFFNRNFALILGDVLALATAIYFSRDYPQHGFLRRASVAASALVLLNFVLLVGMGREISYAFERGLSGTAFAAASEKAQFAFSGWMMLQAALLIVVGFARRVSLARWLGLLLLTATVVKAFVYDMRNLGTGYRVFSYLGLGVLLMCVSFAYQKDWLGLRETDSEGTR